jgi:predicted nucleic acid-binding protein
MRVIVCDAGPIIHLHEACCLPLLRRADNLFLPHRVYLEVQNAIHIEVQWPEWLQVVRLSHNEQNEAGMWQTAGGLHAGEAEALVLAKQKRTDWFLTDDSATRLFVSYLMTDRKLRFFDQKLEIRSTKSETMTKAQMLQ